ncbi:alpha/beta hydrolase [Emticicia sp. BO119]|uniref:alpha/beta hydrolase n=1 Tax=Emticicia sp. BO119 TaxID=2757768 RepID=UPI0015F00F41|nr:alpha/beta hydrolase [Emticicia sp. BO119]MBA4849733.1 alpha/beta hydrolase [Emticicia sp. BO119]
MIKQLTLILLLFIHQLRAQESQKPVNQNQQSYQAELKALGKKFSDSFYPNYSQIYALPEKAFIDKIDSARKGFDATLNKYKAKLETVYVENQQLEIKYYFDKLLIDYPLTHEVYGGKVLATTSKIPEMLKTNLTDFNKPELLKNSDFTNYFKAFLSFQTYLELRKGLYKNQDNQHFKAQWKLIPKYVSNLKCREYWQYEYLFNQIDNNGIKHIDTIYKEFNTTCKDTVYLNKINNIYTEDLAGKEGHIIKTYKTVGSFSLDIHLFVPDNQTEKRPAIVFFHGGSWSEGKPDWFFSTCQSYAQKGWVACAVEYRTYSRHGTLPFEAVMDAKSAIRWIRQNADVYKVDTTRIIATGNSAGGHLALTTALVDNWNEKTDNLKFSAKPNALIINAGVYDLTDDLTAWIRKDLKDKNQAKEISPNYLIRKDFPPALIFHGTLDRNVPYQSARKFGEDMVTAGNYNLTFLPLTGAGHFIWFDSRQTEKMANARSRFLEKLGY